MISTNLSPKAIPRSLDYLEHDSRFVVDWYIGRRCNLDCSYCGPDIHDNHSPHGDIEAMKSLVDKVCGRFSDRVVWSLTGGEPTIHPDFIELCQHIHDNYGCEISVTTNGARPAQYFETLFPFVQSVILSIHFEGMAAKMDLLLEKIVKIHNWVEKWNQSSAPKNKKYFKVRFMAYPGQFELLKESMDFLSENGIQRMDTRIIKGSAFDQDGNRIPGDFTEKYSFEEKEYLDQWVNPNQQKDLRMKFQWGLQDFVEDFHYNDLVLSGTNRFTGWSCSAGLDHIKVDPEGNVFRGSCLQGGVIGNIFNRDQQWDLPTTPHICQKKSCGNLLDLRSSKIRVGTAIN